MKKLIVILAQTAVTFFVMAILFSHTNSRQSAPSQNQPSPARQTQAPSPAQNQPKITAPPPVSSVNNVVVSTTTTHPQYEYHSLANPVGPLYTNQPFLSRIDATSAWSQFVNTNTAPTIAMIDTGFALGHEALTSRWTSLRYDFVNNDTDPSTTVAVHGTYTAGLASLLNPNAKLMPLQVLNDSGTGYTDAVANAVRYAADNGANIISMSLGGNANDDYLHAQIDYAISRGVLVVAAAGNSGCNCLSYPAAYPEVLAVGAATSSDTKASFSSYGANLDVLAPGTAGDVCSSTISGSNLTSAYSCSLSGTSMATPIVAGLAALLWQQNPSPPDVLTTSIIKSASRVAEMGSSYFTLKDGYGRISASSAVTTLTISPPEGVLVSKRSASLSDASLAGGPEINSTCSGVPQGFCTISLSGPNGESFSLGTKTLNAYGYASFDWNAATLGLTPGTWSLSATQTVSGQTKQSAPVLISISP